MPQTKRDDVVTLCPADVEPAVAEVSPSPWPWIVLLAIMGTLLAYELLAPHFGLPTITEWLRAKTGGKLRWVRILGGAALVGFALVHLIFGGPF